MLASGLGKEQDLKKKCSKNRQADMTVISPLPHLCVTKKTTASRCLSSRPPSWQRCIRRHDLTDGLFYQFLYQCNQPHTHKYLLKHIPNKLQKTAAAAQPFSDAAHRHYHIFCTATSAIHPNSEAFLTAISVDSSMQLRFGYCQVPAECYTFSAVRPRSERLPPRTLVRRRRRHC